VSQGAREPGSQEARGATHRLITLESPEGAGKTTQARLLAERLRASGLDVLLTREPGGTELGERVRALVLPASGLPITPRAETLLYCVARAQIVEEVLRPALAVGRTVILDRYADSTLAYQGYGRGLDPAALRTVLDFATGGLWPDLTILLDIPVEEGLRRKHRQAAGGAADELNRFETEALAFHERVRQAYLTLAAAEPARWRIVDASGTVEEVAEDVWRAVSPPPSPTPG
jgi:dTMP kinase